MNNKLLNLCIVGAAGRMGRMVAELAESEGFRVSGALEFASSPSLGQKTGDAVITGDPEEALKDADVVVEFALPEGFEARLAKYLEHGKPCVIGTTGLGDSAKAALHKAAAKIPVINASNFSLGVNLLAGLLKQAAAVLGNDYDVEILEMHHRHKKDAPSGTALFLAEKVEEGRKVGREKEIYGRCGKTGERPSGEIAIHALRGGDVVGDHTVVFAAEGERVEFTHRASSRSNFAKGALKAAAFLCQKEAGLYTMSDVIGLEK
ncbi:4-hydroxy-tetrahydrodipicolinate reductase [bacterium]|nr:4-hydroxy-tetrahydrodipicolinate reductase [bacterium]